MYCEITQGSKIDRLYCFLLVIAITWLYWWLVWMTRVRNRTKLLRHICGRKSWQSPFISCTGVRWMTWWYDILITLLLAAIVSVRHIAILEISLEVNNWHANISISWGSNKHQLVKGINAFKGKQKRILCVRFYDRHKEVITVYSQD